MGQEEMLLQIIPEYHLDSMSKNSELVLVRIRRVVGNFSGIQNKNSLNLF